MNKTAHGLLTVQGVQNLPVQVPSNGQLVMLG